LEPEDQLSAAASDEAGRPAPEQTAPADVPTRLANALQFGALLQTLMAAADSP